MERSVSTSPVLSDFGHRSEVGMADPLYRRIKMVKSSGE